MAIRVDDGVYEGDLDELKERLLQRVTEVPRGQIGKRCTGHLHNGAYLTFDSFYKNAASSDGLDWICKACKLFARSTNYKAKKALEVSARRWRERARKPRGRKINAGYRKTRAAVSVVEKWTKTGNLPDEVEATNRLLEWMSGEDDNGD